MLVSKNNYPTIQVKITMACSKYKSTKETTHAARLSRLLLDPCTYIFRDLLRSFIPEAQFPHILRNFVATLIPIINKDQRNLLYPRAGQYLGTYEDFDLSLLYILLRNISGIPPHKNGWGKQPDPTDRSLSANIDRTREIRNTYCGHVPRVTLPEQDFQRIWQDTTVIIRELEGSLTAGCTTYTDAAKLIKTDTMDPEQENKYLDIIDKQHKVWEDFKDTTNVIIKEQEKIQQEQQLLLVEQDILKSDLQQQGQEIRSQQHRHENELKSALQKQESKIICEQKRLDKKFKSALQKQELDLKSEIQLKGMELYTEQKTQKMGLEMMTDRLAMLEKNPYCEKNNILDNTSAILQTHKSRNVYIRTSAVKRIIEKLKEKKILVLTGRAGCGKTTTAYQVMLELSEESSEPPYTPVLIDSPDEWNKVINRNQRSIVFLDDFIGSTNLDTGAFDKWKSKFDAVSACTTYGQVLMMIGLRKNLLEDVEKYDTRGFFRQKTIIDLSIEKNFTFQDKEKMFAEYYAKCSFKDSINLCVEERYRIIDTDPYYGFPLTCYQYFSRHEFYQLGLSYFLRPNELLYNAIKYKRSI
ncbi:E3 ubiquitin-protein ligase DZIP3-like [Saccostrea cucullata]|uniref:E3 ubiquitin-protein ligase DZIP3-like n=1 Tax=Saccostrea cuccullata TaxID=36930 RepID=UPI002ED2F8FC